MNLKELTDHIEKIFDENNIEINYKYIEFKKEKRKYSKTESIILYIDNIACTCKQMKSFKVQYLCRCNRHIIILLQKYIKKERINCMHCLQDRSFEDHVETKPYSLIKGLRNKNKILIKDFNSYDETFKKLYFEKHLYENEFYYYLPIIYKLNGIELNKKIINNIKYKEYFPCNNQMKFTSKVSFDNGLTWETLKKIELKCSICQKIFNIHIENIRKQNIDEIKCRQCSFNSELFPIKLYKDTVLTYQSKPEKYFLDKCFENNINVNNGFEIQYYWNNKYKTYITDFYLPDLKIIVEIKAKNPFYYDDRLSGKLDAKNAYANNFAKENNMDFRFIFDEYIDSFIYECIEKMKK